MKGTFGTQGTFGTGKPLVIPAKAHGVIPAPLSVIPVKTGIQSRLFLALRASWIPAFAGMTGRAHGVTGCVLPLKEPP